MKIKIKPVLALMLFIAGAGAINYYYYLSRDRLAPLYDANVCFAISYNYYDTLIRQLRPDRFFYSLCHNINFYPPLYMLVPLPFYLLVGVSARAMAMVNLLYLTVLIYAVYKLGNFAYGKPAGLWSVVVLASFPSILGFTRLTHSTIALTAILSLSVYMLVSAKDLHPRKTSILTGALAGIGMLFNSEYWVYLAGPYFVRLVKVWPGCKQKCFSKDSLINCLLFLASCMLIAGPYYYLASRFCFLDISNFKSYAPIWAIQHFDLKEFFNHSVTLLQAMRKQVLTCNFVLFLVSILALNKRILQGSSKVIFFGWFLITLLLVSVWQVAEPRFIVPILPSAAVLISGLLTGAFHLIKKFLPQALGSLTLVFVCLYGGLNSVCFFKEHPYPRSSAELAGSRWSFGMLHRFTQYNPGQELVAYLEQHQGIILRPKIIVVLANAADPAPLALELIYGALFGSRLNIEVQSPMRLAVWAWHGGKDGLSKEDLFSTVFKQANYILYINNSVYQETSNRPEYKQSDNQLLQGWFEQEKDKKLVWEYQDKNGFFTETMTLFQKSKAD